MRLLDLPRLAPPPRVAVVPRSTGGDFNPTGSTWLLASPLAPLAASFVLVVAVGVLFGNPYRVGAATFVELRTEVSPAASALRDGASRVAAVAAGLGQAAVESLPDAGRRASGAIARSFKERESSRPLPETPRR